MTTKEKKNKLEEIANKSKLTAEDRFFVKAISEELGVEFKPRTRCNDCYRDQAIILHRALKTEPEKTDSLFVLREGLDVLFNGRRINAEILTDEIAQEIIAQGFPKKFFAKCL